MDTEGSHIRIRRSLLYVPGDREAMIAKAAQRGADGLILNLEDAVAPGKKELARNAVAQALAALDFGRAEVIVRINPLDAEIGYRDLLTIAPAKPDAILLPKVGSPEEVCIAAWTLARLEEMHGLLTGSIRLMCMIESASGVLAAAQIAGCHPRVAALLFGAADYSAEVGCAITPDGDPPSGDPPSGGLLLHAQSQIVLASRAAGIDAIDTPHMRLDDPDGLARSSLRARQLGFDGKSAIHPGQIGAINSAFSPTSEQIAWAERVLAALPGGDEAHLGVAVLDGQLIEAPHLARARRILSLQAQIASR
jgi:citrate lyase subunit beta / citryl-CoA lyase